MCKHLVQRGGRAECRTERSRGALGHQMAGVHDRQFVAEGFCLFHVVRGQQDRHRQFAAHRPQPVPDRMACKRIETDRGLVEKQHGGSVEHRLSEFEASRHAAGIGVDQTVGNVGQAHQLQRLGNTRGAFGVGIWERDLGVVHKQLVSPAYRSALVLGKALSAGFRGVVQAIVIYALALAMHLAIRFEPLTLLGVLLIVVLGSALFSMFSLIVACIVKTRERFMGVGQVLTMPLFFASSAIYPLEQMPAWLRTVARFNPLTYLVDALRDLMVPSATVTLGWGLDSLILFAIFAGLMVIATRLYPSLVR